MATGLIVSAVANMMMGLLGLWEGMAGIASSSMFVMFAIMWTINGWSQSMGSPPAIISLSRWYPLNIRGTYYGFFSASHNFGEGLSFLFVAALVSAAGWQWGFFGAALAGVLGVTLIALWLHDTPESKGLAPVEVLAGEKTQEEYDREVSERNARVTDNSAETSRIQRAVLRNTGVWILALSSAFMYMSRYAINEWGMFFLQKTKGFELLEASSIIAINTIAGLMNIISGWLIDGQAVPDPVTGELQYDFTYVSIFWVGAAVISFLLPILNWGRPKQDI